MDYPRDIKIMVLLLGFLATCSGKQHAKVSNVGYNYNRGQGVNSHSKILKAVLVHESTGQGLHSGSVSSSNGNAGIDFKVTKQSGYSYPTRQKLKSNLGAADTTPIQVFHESTGNTGNIVRNSSPPHSQNGPSIIRQNPAQTLRYIHENALSRSRSDQNIIDRRQSHSSPGTGNVGYQYEISQNVGNADNFYGTPHQAASNGHQSEISGNVVSTGSSGYQYQNPIQAVNNGIENGINPLQAAILSISKAQNVNLREVATGSDQVGSNGYQYASPIQALNIHQGHENSYLSSSEAQNTESRSAHASSNGYQYQNQGIITSSAFGSVRNENQQNTFTSSSQAQNADLSNIVGVSPQASSNGYQYRVPLQGLSVDHGHDNPITISSSLSQAESINQGNKGYQYPSPNLSPNSGFGNENAQPIFSSSSQTQNVNLQHTASGSGQTILNINGAYNTNPQSGRNLQLDNSGRISNDGYRCENQGGTEQTAISQYSSSSLNSANQGYENPQSVNTQGGYQYADQSAKGGHHNENLRTNGYQYQKSNEYIGYQGSQSGQIQLPSPTQLEQNGQTINTGYPFNGFVQALKEIHDSESPKEEGYRYKQPAQPDAAKSVFKGQPYLPLPPAPKDSSHQTDGYRYDKPDQSGRPQTTFKGHPYLPLPPVSGGW